MFRSRKLSMVVLAGLMLASFASLAPQEAAANGSMGGSGNVGYVYSVTVYYAYNGQWQQYGRYFATAYTNGSIDWGGADQAYSYLQSNGYQLTYTAQFWRVTNNG